MTFRIRGLDPAPLRHLSALHARRCVADTVPGYPCRVSLEDAQVGESLVLVHHVHHAVASPYRAAGPIFIREAADRPFDAVDTVPRMLAGRLVSVRGYDATGDLRDADVCSGTELATRIGQLFQQDAIAYLHVHLAKPGCFACRVDRA
jgi:hypothetical protein